MTTVPFHHPYVDAVLPASVRHAAAGRSGDPGWGRDPVFGPGGLAGRLAGVDVVHVHFGFDAESPQALAAWVEVLRAAGVALVVTVHDLRNPHHADRAEHDAQLAVLLPAAAAVLTLTPGAAAEIADRFGVTALVVPHPAVFAGPTAGVSTQPRTVGVLLKPWRASVVEPLHTLTVAADALDSVGGVLRVDVNEGSLPDGALRDGVVDLARRAAVELVEHPRYDDDALRAHLTGLHATLLVNRFGTHSGWVEAAHDVGTTAIVPSCGHYGEQWTDVVPYVHDEQHGLDPGSLHSALVAAVSRPPAPAADRAWRAEQLAAVRAAHERVYLACGR